MQSLAAVSIVVALSVATRENHALLPLAITQMSIEPRVASPERSLLRIEVLNTGTRTILAWGVSFVLKRPDGTVAPNSGLSVDAGSNVPEERKTAVAPGGTAHIDSVEAVPLNTIATDGVVTFVIFDDDTALGDEHEIAHQFGQRRNRQAFWAKIQTILDAATSHQSDSVAILTEVRERMEAESDPKFREAGAGWYREILDGTSARRLEQTGKAPQGVLDKLRLTIAARKANADMHATRR